MTTDPIPVPPFQGGPTPADCGGGHAVEEGPESTIIVESEPQATAVEE